MQIRPREGGLLYAPARDIVYLYPSVCKIVAGMLEDEWCPALHQWLGERGVLLPDLALACQAYCRFLNIAHENPRETVEDALVRAGWDQVRIEARIALLFYVGATMTGTFFQGVREVVSKGDDTLPPIKRLMNAAKRARLAACMTPWKLRLYRWCRFWRLWKYRQWKVQS